MTLVGRLGRDPELRRLEGGIAVARFGLATSETYQDRAGAWQEQVEWHDVVLWRGLADRAEQQLRKGMLIYLEGKLSTRSYQDRDGQARKVTEVVGSFVRILSRPGGAATPGGESDAPGASAPGASAPGAGADALRDFLAGERGEA